ncbi:MAG: ABC transporter ATP-binding protein [Candidatus Hermodarchaeota archaeon]|nr:ABC transporter ATP-binding protein [Candidatus Hermodarchaeota archaeon]
MTNLLQIENLSVEYKTRRGIARAVDNVFLNLEENKTLGLAGESGCGKSTLGLSIMRLVPHPGRINEGKILFNLDESLIFEGGSVEKGQIDLMQLDDNQMRAIRGRKLAYIFQDPMTSLNPLIRIGDHFTEIIQAHEEDVKKDEAINRGEEILETLGILPERITDYPHQFSGGMRQRVMIGLGIALRPRLLIADEPTTALDVIVEAQILDELATLKKQFNLSMLLITHNLGVLAQTADDIAIMYTGRVMEIAKTESLFEDPKHPYTQCLLKAVPDVRKPDKTLAWIAGAPPDLIDPIPGCMFRPRCEFAMEICATQPPPLEKLDTGQRVACYLYTKGVSKK